MKYWIESQSTHKVYYCVESDEPLANSKFQELIDNGMSDCGQEWLGEKIVGVREISDQDYIRNFNEVNPDLVLCTEADKKLYIVSMDAINEEFVDGVDDE